VQLTGLLKIGEDLTRFVWWVPAVSSPGAVWVGAEVSPEPRACPSFAGRELGWFLLTMVKASYTGAGAGWRAGYTLCFWSKTNALPPLGMLFQDPCYNHEINGKTNPNPVKC